MEIAQESDGDQGEGLNVSLDYLNSFFLKYPVCLHAYVRCLHKITKLVLVPYQI